MKQYAIYLNSAERFILVLDDLWVCLHSAKLLSSKMSLCVCDISQYQVIPNDQCLTWSLLDSSESKQNQQHPSLSIIKKGIVKRGLPLDLNVEGLRQDKEFVEFLTKVLKAALLVDALYNNVNQKFYLDLLDERDLSTVHDDSGVKGGFLRKVNKILYLSKSIDEVRLQLHAILNDEHSSRPTNLKMYKTAFMNFLENE